MKFIKLFLLFLILINGCATAAPLFKPSINSRQQYVKEHSDLSCEIKQAILEGRVIKGMTKKDVKASWGEPAEVDYASKDSNSYFYTERWDESWYYKGAFLKLLSSDAWVLFKKGIVVEIDKGHWYEK